MRARSEEVRRTDRWTAERFELAQLTARAFDLRAARNYLMLSGVDQALVDAFTSRYPSKLRISSPSRVRERRRA